MHFYAFSQNGPLFKRSVVYLALYLIFYNCILGRWTSYFKCLNRFMILIYASMSRKICLWYNLTTQMKWIHVSIVALCIPSCLNPAPLYLCDVWIFKVTFVLAGIKGRVLFQLYHVFAFSEDKFDGTFCITFYKHIQICELVFYQPYHRGVINAFV